MPTPKSTYKVEATDVVQRLLVAERFPEYKLKQGSAAMSIHVENVGEATDLRDASCQLTLRNEDSDIIMTVESVFRIRFSIESDDEVAHSNIADTVSELALKIAYPYHRSAIGHSVIQAGLPSFVIPLAPDSDWKKVVEASKNQSEVSEDDAIVESGSATV